jgi:hypothetical protein
LHGLILVGLIPTGAVLTVSIVIWGGTIVNQIEALHLHLELHQFDLLLLLKRLHLLLMLLLQLLLMLLKLKLLKLLLQLFLLHLSLWIRTRLRSRCIPGHLASRHILLCREKQELALGLVGTSEGC